MGLVAHKKGIRKEVSPGGVLNIGAGGQGESTFVYSKIYVHPEGISSRVTEGHMILDAPFPCNLVGGIEFKIGDATAMAEQVTEALDAVGLHQGVKFFFTDAHQGTIIFLIPFIIAFGPFQKFGLAVLENGVGDQSEGEA